MHKNSRFTIILILIIISTLVRIYQIESQSLWYDEIITVLVARLPMMDGLQFLITDGVHPPLFFLIQNLVGLFGETHTLVRMPALIFGILSVVLVYLVTEKWIGSMSAIIASTLLAVSPFHVWYSQEARMYTLITLFSLVCMSVYMELLHRPKLMGNISFTLFNGLAYLTHYFTLFLPLIQLIHIVVNFHRYHDRLKVWTALQFVSSLPLLIWTYFLWQRPFQQFSIGWIPKPGLIDLVYTLVNFTIGFFGPFTLLHWFIFFGCLFFIFLGIMRTWHDQSYRSVLVLWAFFPPLLIFLLSLRRPVYVDRYLILSLPPLLILMAYGLASIKTQRIYFLTSLFILVFSWRSAEMMTFPYSPQKENWRQVAEFLIDNVKENEVVVTRTLQVALPFQYYTLGGLIVKDMHVNQEIMSKDEFTGGYTGYWLVDWNMTKDAHALGSTAKNDLQRETYPQLNAWINGRDPELLYRLDFPGLSVYYFNFEG